MLTWWKSLLLEETVIGQTRRLHLSGRLVTSPEISTANRLWGKLLCMVTMQIVEVWDTFAIPVKEIGLSTVDRSDTSNSWPKMKAELSRIGNLRFFQRG
jgi:hypothetical protein